MKGFILPHSLGVETHCSQEGRAARGVWQLENETESQWAERQEEVGAGAYLALCFPFSLSPGPQDATTFQTVFFI